MKKSTENLLVSSPARTSRDEQTVSSSWLLEWQSLTFRSQQLHPFPKLQFVVPGDRLLSEDRPQSPKPEDQVNQLRTHSAPRHLKRKPSSFK
ncbi:hypothetical protein M758_5G132000 [Ceratodon purpureus]|nr:hypothetical protein M758_5G132000 [Ceratodon purpureus]